MRALASLLVALLALVAWSTEAVAAPSASGSFDTNKGFQGSSSGGKKGRYEWPELVVGGNAISFISPFQIGAVGYLPKGRFAFQYDRQLSPNLARHWIHLGAGIVFDRADWESFRLDSCDPSNDGNCRPGGVVGYDIYAGYTHRFFIEKKPWLVPHLKGSVGFSWWALPKVGGGREERQQSRLHSWTLNLRPGGGLRLFLLEQLGLGIDVNIPIGFLVHTDAIEPDGEDKSGGFLLGFEILPLMVEYRF
ncbi:hypothetical protein [Paraliomyxa miuraensis]|uniref:hypothetical protein n=1 Tax=Paraliomyxa miuraensis TaxID=376150 RepID=UPI00225B545C|nr:hypothetical protein [Paraliomyxa miuraensis]MCX4246856.1 hypothetical protein [Paraliomyxa miuraensis]